ncbi:MAG: hypothetical protein ACI4RT_01015 [Candidatus Spyradenecus sp.]
MCRRPRRLLALAPLIIIATAACFILDCTTLSLPLECTLARGMENALRALLRGLCLPSTLTCTIAPACSGIRLATASALIASALPSAHPREAAAAQRQIGGHVARHICRAALGSLAGLWLNLARILAIELAWRASPTLGATLHDLALPLIIAPLSLAILALLPRITNRARLLLAIAATIALPLLLAAPEYYPE